MLFVLYLGFVLVNRDMRDNPKRKIIMASTWSGKFFFQILILEASDPTSYQVEDINVTKAL